MIMLSSVLVRKAGLNEYDTGAIYTYIFNSFIFSYSPFFGVINSFTFKEILFEGYYRSINTLRATIHIEVCKRIYT